MSKSELDIYDFMDYFHDKYSLRRVIYYHKPYITDAIKDETIFNFDELTDNYKINITTADRLCEKIIDYFESNYTEPVVELYKRNPSVDDAYNTLLLYDKYNEYLVCEVGTITTIRFLYNYDFYITKFELNEDTWHKAFIKYICHRHNQYSEEELTKLLTAQAEFEGQYKDLCTTLKMQYAGTTIDDLSCIAYRMHMSYGSNFPYNDIFTQNTGLLRLLKISKPHFGFNNAWVYNEDKEILLIAGGHYYNFLTTVSNLARDLHIPTHIVKTIIDTNARNNTIKDLIELNDMVNSR